MSNTKTIKERHGYEEWVKCVRRSHVGLKHLTWCGKLAEEDWAFVDVDHAAENGLKGGRLVVCPECYEAITMALANGSEDQR